MYLVVNLIGIAVFIGIAFLFSKNRTAIKWRSIGVMVVINAILAWFLTDFSVGRAIVKAAADGFNALIDVSYTGIAFAFPSMVHVKNMDFVISSLMPILMIVPMFDILTYIGVLP